MEKLRLSFLGQNFYATLLEEEAPNTVAALRAACPFQSKLVYAKVCDNEIYFHAPFNMDDMEHPVRSTCRHIAFFPPKQGICIWYRNTPTLCDCNLFAMLDEDQLPGFTAAADQIWDKQGEIITVDIVPFGEG